MSNYVFDRNDVSENKGLAIIMAIIPILFFMPFLGANTQNSPYLRFRANQSLDMVIFAALLGVIRAILGVLTFIPLIGLLIKVCNIILGALGGLFWLIGIICVASEDNSGKKYPIIGEIELIK